MQKVRVLCIGKLKEAFYASAAAEYCKRLTRFADLRIEELPERRTLAEEAADLLPRLRGYTVVLAVEGKQLSSEAFAAKMKGLSSEGAEVTFVIGSSCGLDARVKERADLLLSFSSMTFPHQLMRVILLEQIYRAYMINAGSEYHK